MGMAHGKAGKVVWNAEDDATDVDILHITSWSADATGDVVEITSMGDSSKTYLGGFKDFTVVVEANADGAPQVPYVRATNVEGLAEEAETPGGQKVFIELWFGAAAADGIITGPAVATGISHNTDSAEITTVTYAFQVNGPLYYPQTAPTTCPD